MTDTITIIDQDRVFELLDKIASEHGDFCYRRNFSSCQYLAAEKWLQPNVSTMPEVNRCIVGQVLHEIGLDDKQLGTIYGPVFTIVGHLREYNIELSDGACYVLAAAQNFQDGYDVTWAEAVKLVRSGVTPFGRMQDIKAVIGRDLIGGVALDNQAYKGAQSQGI